MIKKFFEFNSTVDMVDMVDIDEVVNHYLYAAISTNEDNEETLDESDPDYDDSDPDNNII